jgi:hypothetical protein
LAIYSKREKRLEHEGHYQELADYWENKGNLPKALAVLEQWLANWIAQKKQNRYQSYFLQYNFVTNSSVSSEDNLNCLIAYYRQADSKPALLRVLGRKSTLMQ